MSTNLVNGGGGGPILANSSLICISPVSTSIGWKSYNNFGPLGG